MSLDDIFAQRLNPSGGVVELEGVPDRAPTDAFAFRVIGGPLLVVGQQVDEQVNLVIDQTITLPNGIALDGICAPALARAPAGMHRFEVSAPLPSTPITAVPIVGRTRGWNSSGTALWWSLIIAGFDERGLLLGWYDRSSGLLSDADPDGPSPQVLRGFNIRKREIGVREMTWSQFNDEKSEWETF